MRTAIGFVNTSAEDCRISLQYCTDKDLPLLREALALCQMIAGNKTKEKSIAARIKFLEKS